MDKATLNRVAVLFSPVYKDEALEQLLMEVETKNPETKDEIRLIRDEYTKCLNTTLDIPPLGDKGETCKFLMADILSHKSYQPSKSGFETAKREVLEEMQDPYSLNQLLEGFITTVDTSENTPTSAALPEEKQIVSWNQLIEAFIFRPPSMEGCTYYSHQGLDFYLKFLCSTLSMER